MYIVLDVRVLCHASLDRSQGCTLWKVCASHHFYLSLALKELSLGGNNCY